MKASDWKAYYDYREKILGRRGFSASERQSMLNVLRRRARGQRPKKRRRGFTPHSAFKIDRLMKPSAAEIAREQRDLRYTGQTGSLASVSEEGTRFPTVTARQARREMTGLKW